MTKCEVRGLRTQYEKVYQLHGGRYRAEVNSQPVHVMNAGRWEDIGLDKMVIGDETHYTNLANFLCTLKGNRITITGRHEDFHLECCVDHPRATYEVNPKGFKTVIPFNKGDEIPGFIATVITLKNLTYKESPSGGYIQFYHKGRRVWSMKRPVLIDANGDTIGIDMDSIPGTDTLTLHMAIPMEWVNSEIRAWPIIFDPTHTSDEITVDDNDTITYTVPGNRAYTSGTAQCRWKGIDDVATEQSTTSVKNENTASGTTSATATAAFPAVPSGGTFSYLRSYHYASCYDPNNFWHPYELKNSWWGTGVQTGYGSFTLDTWSTSITNSGYIGTNASSFVGGGNPGQSMYALVQAHTYYTYYPTVHTVNPQVTISGSASKYTGSLADGVWSSYQTLNGFSGTAENSMNHQIEGSGTAGFQYKYDFTWKRPTAIGYCKVVGGDGSIIECHLADPDDVALDYDCVRIGMPDGTVGCVDLVDTTNIEAGPVRISTPDGIKAWRKTV